MQKMRAVPEIKASEVRAWIKKRATSGHPQWEIWINDRPEAKDPCENARFSK